MKKIAYFAMILACLSVAYYFAIFLPGTHPKIARPSKRVTKTDRASKEYFEMQGKCAKASRAFFDKATGVEGTVSNYECHYCKKENKCFILLKNYFLPSTNDASTLRTEALYDVLSNKPLGSFSYQTFSDGRPPSSGWYLLDKIGKSESEWAEAVKPYMED